MTLWDITKENNMQEIQIHYNLLRIAKDIEVNIDIGNLTKNQLKRVVKQVENGYATSGDATTSYISRSILREYDIPHFIVGNESNSYLAWKGIPTDHPIFNEIEGALAITKLSPPEGGGHYRDTWDLNIRRLERVILERPTIGNADLQYIDYIVRNKIHAVGRIKLAKDHKVNGLLEKLPDMTEFPIVLGREEYSYALPYEQTDRDEDEYYA